MNVQFNTAKIAKEKGFDDNTTYAWCERGGLNKYTGKVEPITYVMKTNGNSFGDYFEGKNWNKKYNDNPNRIVCSAPTQSELQKWLREKHKIEVYPICIRMNSKELKRYQYCIISNNYTYIQEKGNFEIFEQAFEEGLLEALKLI